MQTLTTGRYLSPFHLRLFGSPSLKGASGETPPGLGWGKPLALLCLLAVRKEVRRDEVVDLLWRGVEEDKARNAFRQALHRLRSAIGEDVLPQDRERLRLIPGESLSTDLDRFEAAVSARRFGEAAEVAVGDFLENASLGESAFDMWVEQERMRLRTRVGRVLTDATSQASAEGRWTEAVAWTQRLMSVAPFETTSAQLAATTLVAAGRRLEARDLLKQFASNLESELGLALPAELQALFSRLDKQAGPADAASARSTSHGAFALPFVGREAELSQLVTLCRATAEESGGFALVKGSSGIGKSRLLAELTAHIRSLGRVTTLLGREHVAGIQLPYAVFAEALRPLARAQGVVGASRHLLAEAARLLPELRDELDLPAVSDVEDDAGRLRFFEGVAALIDAAAFERPIVLVIDDAHLMGPSTLEMLAYLCARLSRSAVTFVVALNPSETPASVLTRLESIARPDSQTHPGRALSLSLALLSASAAHEAVALAAKALALDNGIAATIVARAEGEPSRLADLVRRVARGERIPTTPVSLRQLALDRIARLSSSQRRLLFVIAIIGRPSTRAVVGAAAHLPSAAIDEAIDALVAEGLVDRQQEGLIAVDADITRIALDIAGPSTRAFLSGWIADELSSRSWPAAELARLFASAGQAKPAFEQSRRAAFDALAVGAVPEAIHHLQNARSSASSPVDAAAVESLLAAIGAGNRQIRSAEAGSPAVAEASAIATEPAPPPAVGRLAALFPNWRLLLGAAVATLVVSSLVLADRSRTTGIETPVGASDTLWVAEDASRQFLRAVTGEMSRGFTLSARRPAEASVPAWIDSLSRPWANPIAAPRGRRVAVERVTPSGSDLLIISADRRDTTPLLVGLGDARALGWSPDGTWLLASHAPAGGSFEARLLALRANGAAVERRVMEATPQRSVTEAAWSPDGTRIAWVARVGAERQLEVFVSNADGSDVQNVSRNPADDQHVTWSPNGDLLAFTSVRDGNAELYARSFTENRLWRLTFDPSQDDASAFSSDGRLIAFESTRGGTAGVYVMPALGGTATRVGSTTLSVVRWQRGARRHVERVRVEQGASVMPGDTSTVRLAALDQFDESLPVRNVEWILLDSAIARRVAGASMNEGELRLVARRAGLARVVGNAGGWRYDTAFVRVGNANVSMISAADGTRAWRALGVPAPTIRDSSIVLRADREWDSGILSRPVPLLPSLTFTTDLELPLSAAADPTIGVTVALVAVEDTSAIDAVAPQFLRYASFTWNAEVGRFVYAVGREIFTEPVGAGLRSPLTVVLAIEQDSTMSFTVNGQRRWHSSIRAIGAGQGSRVQAWISGRATAERVRISRTAVYLAGADSIRNR